MKLPATTTIALIALRAAAIGARTYDATLADRLTMLANLIAAGKATDEHMQTIADKLKNGSPSDAEWDDVLARAQADSDELQGKTKAKAKKSGQDEDGGK